MSAPPLKTFKPGTRFERLTVVRDAEPRITNDGRRQSFSDCVCDCGKETVVRNTELTRGGIKSCGCLTVDRSKERLTTHGLSQSLTGHSIRAANARCNNPKHMAYHNYGGRGITIDPAWVKNPQLLIDEIGARPSKLYSIDRIDNDGNYESGNVRWATKSEQASNTRKRLRRIDGTFTSQLERKRQ